MILFTRFENFQIELSDIYVIASGTNRLSDRNEYSQWAQVYCLAAAQKYSIKFNLL